MRGLLKFMMISASALIINLQARGQAPSWSVTSSSYSNSMNVVGYLWLDKIESVDDQDLVAAFIDGEVRGVANPVFQPEVNRYVVFLTLFSNSADGVVSFKAYDNSEDKVVDILATVQFSPDDLVGGLENYFIWSDVALNDQAELLKYSLPGQFNDFSIENYNVNISVNQETALTSLVASFTISEGAIARIDGVTQESGLTANNYTESVLLRVQSENGLVIEDYNINVVVGNETPTNFTLSSNQVVENNEVGIEIGNFSVSDDESNHTYAFALGDGDSDNHLFSIEGDRLKAGETYNFEENTQYSIRVKVTDSGANVVESSFVIEIQNQNDNPSVVSELNDQIINEDVPYAFRLEPSNFEDEDSGDSLTLTASGLPDWLSFVSATGVLSGIPENDDTKLYALTFIATDRAGATVDLAMELEVLNTNDAPIIANPLEDQLVMVDEELIYQFKESAFSDIDPNDQLTYGARLNTNSDLPDWLTFDPATRTFSGTPSIEDVGIFFVLVTATDQGGESVNNIFTLTVEGVVTGLESLPNLSKLVQMSPNPASDILKVDASVFNGHPVDLQIHNINGAIVLSDRTIDNTNLTINVRGIKPGLYILSMTDGKSLVKKKVIIKR